MSHITAGTMKILDLDALKAAGDRLGFEFMEGQQNYRWYEYWVGDYPNNTGRDVADFGKCQHALKIKGNDMAYEIGIVPALDGQGFELLYDFYDGSIERLAGVGLEFLHNEYMAEVSTRELTAEGYMVTRTIQDGQIILTANA